MKLHNPNADIYVPDGAPVEKALARTTHLGVGAHQDDLEFMTFHGIEECFGQADKWFTGVTCTNGAGSSRAGIYAQYTDEQMQQVRRIEQRKAAFVGGYSAMVQLDYSSSGVKDPSAPAFKNDLVQVLTATQPEVVYTHNLADKHDTHVAVVATLVRAIRALPKDKRPKKVYGCEIWRSLDWVSDTEKTILDASRRTNLAAALSAVFDSQISGGKRYDLAVMGRRQANATFLESHGVDEATHLTFAMDLSPLAQDDALDPVQYVLGYIDRFRADVEKKIRARMGL